MQTTTYTWSVEMSKILVARSGDLGFVKVVGRGSFQNSGCLKAFYQQLLKDGVTRFVIDLGACSYLDSTFLGILLGLGLKLREAGNGLLNILNASARNLELLRNLGLDRLINIAGGSFAKAKTAPRKPVRSLWGAMAAAPCTLRALRKRVWKAYSVPRPRARKRRRQFLRLMRL